MVNLPDGNTQVTAAVEAAYNNSDAGIRRIGRSRRRRGWRRSAGGEWGISFSDDMARRSGNFFGGVAAAPSLANNSTGNGLLDFWHGTGAYTPTVSDNDSLGSALKDTSKAVWNTGLGLIESVSNLPSGALPVTRLRTFLQDYRARYDTPAFGETWKYVRSGDTKVAWGGDTSTVANNVAAESGSAALRKALSAGKASTACSVS